MPEGMHHFGEPKSPDVLSIQRKQFLDALNPDDLELTEREINRLRNLDISNKDAAAVEHALRQILGFQRGNEIWSMYKKSLEKTDQEKVENAIDGIERNLGTATSMLRFMDLEFLKEHASELERQVASPGEVVCGPENIGENLHVVLMGKLGYKSYDRVGHEVKTNDEDPYTVFGDQAILKGKKMRSTDTVSGFKKAVILNIPRDLALEALEQYKDFQLDLAEPGFLEVPIDGEVADELIASSRINFYRRNQIMMREGESANRVMIILEGKAVVVQDSQVIADAGRGAFIGDMEQFGKYEKAPTYRASVVSRSDSDPVVLEISREEFREILIKHPKFAGSLLDNFPNKRAEDRAARRYGVDGTFDFEFGRMEKWEESEVIKHAIEREANITVGLIRETNPGVSEEQIESLFAFICQCMEQQQIRDPKFFVPHGAMHSISVVRFCHSCINIQDEENKTGVLGSVVEKIYGPKRGEILMRLAAHLHDLGYIELAEHRNNGEETPKWKHQEMSAAMVRMNLPYEKLNSIFPLSEKEYEDMIRAIQHHGSDNDDPTERRQGRDFVIAKLEEEPLLVILRIADNLDLGVNRLNVIQRSPEFLAIMKKMYEATNKKYATNRLRGEEFDYTGESGKEKRAEIMSETIEEEINRLWSDWRRSGQNRERAIFLRQLGDELYIAADNDDWKGFLHYRRSAMAQGAFIRQEIDYQKRKTAMIFIEYNRPYEEWDDKPFHDDELKLKDSIRKSLDLSYEGADEPLHISFRRVFPVYGDNAENNYGEDDESSPGSQKIEEEVRAAYGS